MTPLKRIFAAFSLYICIAVFYPVPGQYRFDTWTTDDGLPQNGVREITQTPEGYLWFTTFDGLVRFDGVRFTTFNKSNTKGIINNRFTGIFADKDGTIYATTMEDGILTIYRNGVFTSFTSEQVPGHYIERIKKGADGELRFLSIDDDRKAKSWYHLTEGKFEFIEKEANFEKGDETIYQGRAGIKWTVSKNGVTELKDGRSTFFPLDLTTLKFGVNPFEDNEGNFWLGEYRVHRIRDGKLTTFDKKEGLPQNTIYHKFWQEEDGSVWFASGGGSTTGIGLAQVKDDDLAIWNGKDQKIANRMIQSVFKDREGTTWLATDKGLVRRRKQVIQGFSTEAGIDHTEIYPLYRDREGSIWIGSSRGLTIYRNGKFDTLRLKPSRSNIRGHEAWRDGVMSVQSLWEDPNGKMWVGLAGGIYLVQNGIAEPFHMGSHVFAIKNDRFGNVWAATNEGLLRFNNYKLTAKYSTADGLPNEFMTFIFEDSKGVLWFGGYGGLTKYEDGKFVNYTANDGLAGNYVRTIYEDREGVFWIGTYDEGMSRFKDGHFVNYKEKDGLFSSGVFAIEEDERGYFWISSNQGIYRVNRQELNEFADGKIAKINTIGYGKEDGMLSNECNGGRQPASLRDDEGKFWFPTQDGVAVVDPRAEETNPLPPSVVVEEALVDRQPVDIHGGLNIEAGQKDIEIRYTGISMIKSDQIKFKYKLEGHDADWIDAGNRRTAYYSYLPPGNYTFRVMAANSDGIWNEKGAGIAVDLKPYFYQTTFFYLLCIFGVAVALLAVWKISVYQLEARERRLTRLVAERTAELAAVNVNLQNLANSDGLTKIGNRRRFESFLADEWHRAIRFKTAISMAMIDIDHFKNFNDAYGHQAGDDCLQKVAEALAEAIKRPTDLVARFGGEEFALILGGTDAAGALLVAESAVANVMKLAIPHNGSNTSEFLTVSVGIATIFPKLETSEADLIKAADLALYQAKEDGRNRIYIFDDVAEDSINSVMLTRDPILIS